MRKLIQKLAPRRAWAAALALALAFVVAGALTGKPAQAATRAIGTTQVQWDLAGLGYLSWSGIDGVYGPVTTAAVKTFQSNQCIAVDGIAGPVTDSHFSAVVRAVQAKAGATQDGLYGPLTKAAVERYQGAHGLSVDGIAGPNTMRSMGITRVHSCGGTPPPAPAPPPSGSNCAAANNCTPATFAGAILRYGGIGAPVTGPNLFALETWERAEGGNWNNSARCNPLNTTQSEPGSYSINSVGVKAYVNGSGHTCWYWGIKANGDTLQNGYYGGILYAMRHPAGSNYTQCVDLARAVGASPWGTGNFSADC